MLVVTLPFASRMDITGCVTNATPVTAPAGCEVTTNCVAVPGVPAFIPSGGPDAFVRERAVEVTAVFEPAATLPPDTDALAEASGAAFIRTTVNASIASGRSTPLAVVLP